MTPFGGFMVWKDDSEKRIRTMKRFVDVCGALIGLIVVSPILLVAAVLIWRQDGHSPFYIAPRVGNNGRLFNMVKLRSMIIGADKTGVDSTAGDDPRITRVGYFVRRFKLDEFTQLWNVLRGEMSLVGPRPNVKRETDLYTPIERRLLKVSPGVTDFASIVFADENDILENSGDPDIAYNQLIRPWKSRLGLIYVDNWSLGLDLELILLTIIGVFSRSTALWAVNRRLVSIGVPEEVAQVAWRAVPLTPQAPPGSDRIVNVREPVPAKALSC